MVFSSPLFLFAFLPITLLFYYCLPNILKNLFLFIASFIFYAWGEMEYSYLILVSITTNYFLSLLISRFTKSVSLSLLIIGIIINLIPLIYFKYSNFIKVTVGFNPDNSIVLPLGISFFTFHSLSYIIDVYRKKSSPQKNFINLGLYITNFPQLVAGPIVRYPEIESQLNNHQASLDDFVYGIKRFVIGLAKKVLIANTVAKIADQVFLIPSDSLGTSTAWLGIICYTIQIYFDFSGYSDMAIGLGKMFGFSFPENFKYPYISRSVQEFWRRWHISLSNWFRDYVYVPMGGNRKGNFRTYFNLITIFFLCGLWHGASWSFVVWGLWHGTFLIIERLPFGKSLEKIPRIFKYLYTLAVVMIGWVFFKSETLSFAIDYIQILAGIKNVSVPFALYYFPDTEFILAIIAGIMGSAPVIPYINNYLNKLHKNISVRILGVNILKLGFIAVLAAFSAMSLASGTYNPFIYFRF